MSAHIDTVHVVQCFECGLTRYFTYMEDARSAALEHNDIKHADQPKEATNA